MSSAQLPEEQGRPQESSTGQVESVSVAGSGLADKPTGPDTLGFGVYVEAVGRFLTHRDTGGPLTISVEGEWGSGKTFFMRQLREALREKGQKTVWFNAWRHDQEEALWAAFALQFVDELSGQMASRRARWTAKWRLMRRRFDWQGGWFDLVRIGASILLWSTLIIWVWGWGGEVLEKAGDWLWQKEYQPERSPVAIPRSLKALLGFGATLAGLTKLFQAMRGAGEILGNPLRYDLRQHLRGEDYAARLGFIERFHRDFSRIVEVYAADQEKVFVFIDDLDRCAVPKAADLMQAMNLMIGEDPRLLFLVGMDRQKVAAGLAVKFRELLPFWGRQGASEIQTGVEFGYAFIEKFVQLPFRVPVAGPQDLERFLEALSQRPPLGDVPDRGGVRPGPKTGTWKWLVAKLGSRNREAAAPEGSQEPSPDRGLALAEGIGTREPRDRDMPGEEQRRWTDFVLRVERDSSKVREVAQMVAETLDLNPRRLKQFVNVFRLRAYIAYNTGLFNPPVDQETGGLTLEQLGKFVAIELRWPLLLVDLEVDPGLLHRLSSYAEQIVHGSGNAGGEDLPERWRKDRPLLELLAKNSPTSTSSGPIYQRHTLTHLDLRQLLQVSPRRVPPASPPIAAPVSASPVPPPESSDPAVPLMEMILIPAGPFIRGTEDGGDDEKPQRQIYLDEFYIAKYPLTNLQYKAFLDANPSREAPEGWNGRDFPEGKKNHPVVYISWEEAQACAAWFRSMTGIPYRLPTEAEWEKAARGTEGRVYPWGEEFDQGKCNTEEGGVGGTTPVGSYPAGASPYGVLDMAGNVWEWCADWYQEDYYQHAPERNPPGPEKGEARVVRGGSWIGVHEAARCACRYWFHPEYRVDFVGVRFSRTS